MEDGDRRNRPWSSVGDDMTRIHAGRVAGPASSVRNDIAAPPKRRPVAMVLGGGLAIGLIAGAAVIASVREMPRGPAPRPVLAATPARVAPPATGPLPAIAEGRPMPALAQPVVIQAEPRMTASRRGDTDEGDDDQDAPVARADVLAADRALRAAYDDAVEAGVDRRRLVSIRNRWARLSATDYDRPERLIAAYSGMTDQLQAETQDERY